MSELQPTRSGKHREAREFDQTQLRENNHGQIVHRDYAAHFFRWVTVKETLGNDHKDRVLDVGCGQDQPLVRILRATNKYPQAYVGVDLNPIANPQAPAWSTTLDKFNFIARWQELRPRGPFNLACCFEVLEHMAPENGLKLLKAVRELLTATGKFYLSTPVFDGKAALNHLHEFTIPELQSLIEKAGLRVAARYGTFGNVKALEKVLTPEEKVLWARWRPRLGNDGLSVVFATDHPDQCRNNLWVLTRGDAPAREKRDDHHQVARATDRTARADGGVSLPGRGGRTRGAAHAVAVHKKLRAGARNVLVINSYGGSLVVAARDAGLTVTASYEHDGGYGLNAQRKNFPDLVYVDREPWPAADLRDQLVIAHPPCAGFSIQNANSPKRATNCGADGAHFKKTQGVVDYSLSARARAVLIESVTGAYEPTRGYYDQASERHGYCAYRVLQNAITFGVPQWRPRFWTVLVRKDLAPKLMTFNLTPLWRSVGELLADVPVKPEIATVVKYVERQHKKLLEAGLSKRTTQEIFEGTHGYGRMPNVLLRSKLATAPSIRDPKFMKKWLWTTYDSANINILDPDGFAPTLMRTSLWVYNGEPIGQPGYNLIMGFPPDYWFPDGEHLELRSRGVCPPVARWLLEEVLANLDGRATEVVMNATTTQALRPGETANFLVARNAWRQKNFNFQPARPAVAVSAAPAAKSSPRRAPARSSPSSRAAAARYRLLAGDRVAPLLERDNKTHNAAVAKALLPAQHGLTLDELVDKLCGGGRWETTSPNPRGIISWHLNHLVKELKIVEKFS